MGYEELEHRYFSSCRLNSLQFFCQVGSSIVAVPSAGVFHSQMIPSSRPLRICDSRVRWARVQSNTTHTHLRYTLNKRTFSWVDRLEEHYKLWMGMFPSPLWCFWTSYTDRSPADRICIPEDPQSPACSRMKALADEYNPHGLFHDMFVTSITASFWSSFLFSPINLSSSSFWASRLRLFSFTMMMIMSVPHHVFFTHTTPKSKHKRKRNSVVQQLNHWKYKEQHIPFFVCWYTWHHW